MTSCLPVLTDIAIRFLCHDCMLTSLPCHSHNWLSAIAL